jgi:hypothetical protein
MEAILERAQPIAMASEPISFALAPLDGTRDDPPACAATCDEKMRTGALRRS